MASPGNRRPRALYYRMMNYQRENVDLLEANFELVSLGDPREDRDEILRKQEVLFAPLGFKVDAGKMDRCPTLKAIVSNTTGIPHIDAVAAQARNVSICALHDEQAFLDTITPTSEHAIGLIIAACRLLPAAHDAAKLGRWDRRPWGAPKMLSRMRLAIVGYGRIGKKVASAAEALGMHVTFFDPYVPGGVDNLYELARDADVLSLHAPANRDTEGLVTREVLEALPEGAIVVNTARGELLDEDALIDLLETGAIRAAALDTIDGEYEPGFSETFIDSRLCQYARDHDNLILTPHIGGSTIDAWHETERFVIEKAIKELRIEIDR